MKNVTALFLILGILIFGCVWLINSSNAISSSEDSGEISGDFQNVVIGQEGYNYGNIEAIPGRPIKVSLDDSVSGCLRSVVFNIDGKRYTKYFKDSKDTLELPPLEQGTYSFSCTMGMAFGKLNIG